jgi:hypothetical protein
VAATLWFLAAYAATAVFRRTPVQLTLVLALSWGVRVTLSPARDSLIAGPLLALIGPLFEAALSSTGAFR